MVDWENDRASRRTPDVGTAPSVSLIALGAIFGDDEQGEAPQPSPFGYAMTAAQYSGLQTGLDEADFGNRLDQTGLPENLTRDRYVALFPPHEEDFACSYWEISDQLGRLARICFDSDGKLAQKLERNVFEESPAVSA